MKFGTFCRQISELENSCLVFDPKISFIEAIHFATKEQDLLKQLYFSNVYDVAAMFIKHSPVLGGFMWNPLFGFGYLHFEKLAPSD